MKKTILAASFGLMAFMFGASAMAADLPTNCENVFTKDNFDKIAKQPSPNAIYRFTLPFSFANIYGTSVNNDRIPSNCNSSLVLSLTNVKKHEINGKKSYTIDTLNSAQTDSDCHAQMSEADFNYNSNAGLNFQFPAGASYTLLAPKAHNATILSQVSVQEADISKLGAICVSNM